MALVVHPPPVDGLRRSPRIRVRRQTNLSRPSCLLAHPQTAVSRRTLPRSTHAADLSIHPNPSAIVASLATHAQSGIRPPCSLAPAAAGKRRARASTGSSSTAPSSSRNRRPAARKHPIPVVVPHPSSSVPVLAGSKRKRSRDAADRPDRAAYELVAVPAAGEKTVDEDEEFQTPRQLRYAKRQRLLTSLSDNETPATRADVGRLGSSTSFIASNSSPEERSRPERPPTPRPKVPTLSVPDATPPPLPAPSFTEPCMKPTLPDLATEEPAEPTLLPFHRLKLAPRERRPETADTGLWKLACQERVEFLKETYRAVYEAVVQAEELAAQKFLPQAPSTASESVPSPSSPVTAPFTLYTPSSCAAAALVDADGDMDMDAEYSSDWDSDEDEDLLFDAHAQTFDGVDPFSNATNAPTNLGGQAFGPPTLPPLASVPVYALECVPEQTGRNGVPFVGRGTPVDRARRAEWLSPAVPLLPRAMAMDLWMRHSRSSPAFYAPQPLMSMGFEPMQIDIQPQFEQQEYAQHECMPWLDPALRAASSSPSPSPVPAVPYTVPCTPAHQLEQPDFAMATPEYPSTPDLSSSPSSSSSSLSQSGSPSPTGCAWHATFLQCLQSPTGCAPCFSSPPTSGPVAYVEPPNPTPQHGAATTQAFIGSQPQSPLGQGMELDLEQEAFAMRREEGYVRVHTHTPLPVVSGSVTLSHALG
ncbi:hypothetical protein GSI_09510 [Ganoderma sinense ZZ0214-1]|uniref:Uncharacterized protein n=1 Tax=Ganoderma sinense ZZ0214-1 TaxID=1077348 RepID=A0A2G8S3K3_9APHY|nr:hypothetical protein GSI_09510 [Ganoderma sinense ZZ0214-1]